MIKLPAIVEGAQVFSAVAWLFVAYHYLPSLSRVARKAMGLKGELLTWDSAGCWASLIGITQIAFNLRWLLLGRDDMADMSRTSLIIWAPLYLMNAATAIGVLHTWRYHQTDTTSIIVAGRRASDAVGAWMVLALVCIGAASWSL